MHSFGIYLWEERMQDLGGGDHINDLGKAAGQIDRDVGGKTYLLKDRLSSL